uniref:Calsyntenin C-terminal domain-containing protein n=1 Tax=Megaselia scalaris TaxID=36166 RepID=T1GSL6_MEGSC
MNGEHDDLDFCTVNVFPSLNSDHEELLLENDENLGIDSNVKALISKDGVELKGRDGVTNYVGVLKSLVYTNKKPAYYLNRVFKLSCAQLNAQFKNYEYVLTLTVLHPKQMGPPATVTKSTVSASVKMNVVHDEAPSYHQQ